LLVAQAAMTTPNTSTGPLSLYVHIPFCHTRCTYCVFNTYAGLESLIPAYVDALCVESEIVAGGSGSPELHTIYFGGGTPSILTPDQIARIILALTTNFRIVDGAEITLEANPTHVNAAYFRAIRHAGVNRISLGAQSAHPDDLRLFNRRHSWTDLVHAVDAVRAGGFDNFGLDLIYGAPRQTIQRWADTLRRAVELEPAHLSLYSLSIDEGSPLYDWVASGKVKELDSDLAADMYNYASDCLEAAGYIHYEISNWAKRDSECSHNVHYWRRKPFLALGAGAYGFFDEVRYGNVDSPDRYVSLVLDRQRGIDPQLPEHLSPAVDAAKADHLSDADARAETMILGLRLLEEGVVRSDFAAAFGAPLEEFYGNELADLQCRGLVAVDDTRIVLTKQARLIANLVFKDFV
jgi:oxygen-independent coproporphyrinogen-3 oxidase